MTSLPLANRPPSSPPAPDLAVHPEAIRARLEDHAREAAGAFAPNTVLALAADSREFSAWCAGQGRASLPATSETVAVFVDSMAVARAPATVRRY